MSLQRLMLRAAFVQALSNGATAPYPTIAENRVFDSRMGPIPEAKDKGGLLPVIAVYTDLDERSQIETGNPAGQFKRSIDVVAVLSIGTWGRMADADGQPGVPVWGPPETDAELEALLDLFELQFWRAIYADNAHSEALHNLVQEIREWKSIPGREPRGNLKLSERQIVLNCVVGDDCRPHSGAYAGPAPGEDDPLFPVLAARAPYLTGMLADIAGGEQSYLGPLKRTIAQLTGAEEPAETPVLEGLDVVFSPHPSGHADVGATIEIEDS